MNVKNNKINGLRAILIDQNRYYCRKSQNGDHVLKFVRLVTRHRTPMWNPNGKEAAGKMPVFWDASKGSLRNCFAYAPKLGLTPLSPFTGCGHCRRFRPSPLIVSDTHTLLSEQDPFTRVLHATQSARPTTTGNAYPERIG